MLGVYLNRRNTDYYIYSLFCFLLNLQQTEPNWPPNSTDTRDLTAQKGRLHAVQFFPYQTKDNRHYLYQRCVFTYVPTCNSVCLLHCAMCTQQTSNCAPLYSIPVVQRRLLRSRPKVYPSHMGWAVDAGGVLEHVIRADLKSLAWEMGDGNAKIPRKIISFI